MFSFDSELESSELEIQADSLEMISVVRSQVELKMVRFCYTRAACQQQRCLTP